MDEKRSSFTMALCSPFCNTWHDTTHTLSFCHTHTTHRHTHVHNRQAERERKHHKSPLYLTSDKCQNNLKYSKEKHYQITHRHTEWAFSEAGCCMQIDNRLRDGCFFWVFFTCQLLVACHFLVRLMYQEKKNKKWNKYCESVKNILFMSIMSFHYFFAM